MFKDLKYYKEFSEQLGKEIEICESAYQNFEKAVDLTKKSSELTAEQKAIGEEFAVFCENEGFTDTGINKDTYPRVKEAIVERVNFLKEQKTVYDKMVSLYSELDTLKNKGEISQSEIDELKKRAASRYAVGTPKYNQELERVKKDYVSKKIEKANEAIETTKEEIKKTKKENGISKVVSSVFGPTGNNIYNTYAKIHNKNVDLRKKRVLNFVVKAGMVVGYAFLCASLQLTGLPLIASVLAGGYAAWKTIKNTFERVPAKLPIKEKFVNLKESWFRYKKCRGLAKLSTNKKLYQGVDFSKYNTEIKNDEPVVETPAKEPVKEEKEVKDIETVKKDEEPIEIEESNKTVKPIEPVEVDEAVKLENPVVEIPAEIADENKDEKTIDESVKSVENPIVESVNIESPVKESEKNIKLENKTVGLKYNEENKKRLLLLRDTIKLQKGMNYSLGAKCENMDDVIDTFEKFSSMLNKYEKGEFFAVNSDGVKTFNGKPEQITKAVFSLLNAREFLAKNEMNSKKVHGIYDACNNMIFNEVPEELLEVVNRDVNYRKTFGVGRETKKNNVNDMTIQSRNDAFNRIMNLIYDESMLDKSILGDIYKEKSHYNFTDLQLKEIETALKEREEYIVNRRRGK